MKILIFTSTVFLAGCAAVGPAYVRPQIEAPAQYKELDGWRRAQPADTLPRGSWWSVFGDAGLDRLIAEVDLSNQNLRAAEARYREARALADQARAGLFPTVGANASAARSKGASSSYNAALNASWEPDLWGGVRRSVEAGNAGAQAAAIDIEAVHLSTIATLAQDYYSLRIADGTAQLLRDTVAAYERTLELTRGRYAAGVAGRADVVQAELQLKTAQAQLVDVGVGRAQLEHAIALLVGKPPADFAIEAVSLDVKVPEIPAGVPSTLLERRPDIAEAERNVAAANARIGVAQAAFYPSLTLSGSAGLAGLLSAPTRVWSLGAAFAQVLFDGGLRKAQKAQAVAAYDEQVATYRQTALTAFQEVEDNLAALRILGEEARLQEDVVRSAQESLELTTNQYKSGVVSYLNVITAQTTLLQNEVTALNLTGRRLTATAGLVKALGGGWNEAESRTNAND